MKIPTDLEIEYDGEDPPFGKVDKEETQSKEDETQSFIFEHPIIHCLIIGGVGSGKTQLASTFPKPMLVYFWDGYGNDQPYLDQGEVSASGEYEDGTSWKEVTTSDGKIVIEYFHDEDPTNPSAYDRFIMTLAYLNKREWKTIVFDSVSEAVKTARWGEQFRGGKESQGDSDWRHWSASADSIERIIGGNFKSYPCNTVVIAHLADKLPREDAPFWPIDLPGRLSTNLPRAFGEVYCLRFIVDEQGKRRRALQTEGDGTFIAKSHLGLPEFCEPYYNDLWRGEESKVDKRRIAADGVKARARVIKK